jgi:hypothetical protein
LLLTFISVLTLCAFSTPATEPREDAPEPRVETRVEQLLQRATELEKRVAVLEQRLLPLEAFEPDKRGILRDATGRPIGVWGVDGPSLTPPHR